MASLKRIINFIYSLLSIIGTILIAVAVATGYWRSGGATYEGLWSSCIGSNKNCSLIGADHFDSGTDKTRFDAVRATLIMAILLQGCSVAVAILTTKSEKNFYPLLLFIEATSLIFAISGITIYRKYFHSTVLKFDWSFFVGLGGVCVNIISFLLFLSLGLDRIFHCL